MAPPASEGSSQSYDAIDRHSLNAPPGVTASIPSLAAYLVQPAQNDREKARAIYRWVTANIAYDVRGFATGNPGDTRPESVLRSRVSVCAGYASLFQALARAAGLDAVVIQGSAKGYGYAVGSSASQGVVTHAWNAVKIDGQWQFVECTWGAGVSNVAELSFRAQFEPFYFLTSPADFAYSHLPKDSRWQLLDRPITGEEFDNLADVRPIFFDYGLRLESHKSAVIRAGASVEVTLQAPDNIVLMADLEQNGQKLPAGYAFTQRIGAQYQIFAATPQSGDYVLQIFARRRDDTGPYTLALDYRLEAAGGAAGPGEFPYCFGAFNERGAYLYGPLQGGLRSGPQFFKILVPGAASVTVTSGGRLYYLQKHDDLFSGSVDLLPGSAAIHGWFDPRRGEGLLQYTVQ